MEEFEKLAIDGQVELFTPSPQTPAAEEPQTPATEEAAAKESSEKNEPGSAPADSTENST
jgi:hypothetical protein